MRLLFIYLIVAVELVVATASSAQTVNWAAKNALLDLGMTEQQVTKTVGSAPNKVEMDTCGQLTKQGAWTCKIHTYGSGFNKLRVWFQQSPKGPNVACGQLECFRLVGHRRSSCQTLRE
jgi:hypothetical protein